MRYVSMKFAWSERAFFSVHHLLGYEVTQFLIGIMDHPTVLL